jgi:penicillin amidase
MVDRLLPLLAVLAVLTLRGAGGAAETPDALAAKAHAILAHLEGEIAVPGLKEPVEVLRDRWGVPHIYAKNQDDLFFAQGFVTAQDRLFQMDLWRRLAVGETAEVLGRRGLEGDRFARLVKYRGGIDAEWASYAPDARRIATAFTRGINAYIDQVGDRLPIEFTILGIKPKKWQPEDCLGRMAGIIMTRNFRSEVARAELVAAVGVEKARRIAPVDPAREYGPAPGLDLAGIDRTVLAGYEAATRPWQFTAAGGGSNNWVVDGTLSASGKPLLANDPHRPISLPSLRYLVHLNAPGWNVIGSGEPALPGAAVGHNDRIAWGFTIVGTDQADLYVEETNPDDPTQYKVADRWEKMTIVREPVPVRGEAAPVALELRFTRHGPVLHQDAKRHRAYALKWVGSEPGTAGYLGCLAVDRAQNWRDFTNALKAWKSPAENMIFADVDGNIGWVAAGLTPVRKGWDGLLPVPGAGGAYEWRGFLAVKDLPQAYNPAGHRIATANHNILPQDYSHEIGYEWAPGYRFRRIEQRLKMKHQFNLEDFASIQQDNTSLAGQALARLVRIAAIHDPELRPHVELLAGWDGVLSRESQAGPLYAVWLQELLDAFYRPHVPERCLEFLRPRNGVGVMLAALEHPEAAWFGKDPTAGRDRLLRETFARAVKKVQAKLGNDPSRWAWGKLHTVTFRHPLAALGPAYAQAFNLGPLPRPGDGLAPNAASYNATFEQISGASYRQLFDLADWDRGLATSTPGQSGQPGSPHYADLLPLWAEGRYFPLVFSRTKVEQSTRHRLLLKPAAK